MRGRVAALVVLALAFGCKKKKKDAPVVVEAGVYTEDSADVEAKQTLQVVTRVYPLLCDANAAAQSWTKCREEARGFTAVKACAEKTTRAAKNALAGLRPSGESHGECADDLEKASVALLNTTPAFLGDVVKWINLNAEALIPELAVKPLGEACRDKPDLCKTEPHDYDDAYRAMRINRIDTLDCTAKIFRCGESQAPDCWPANIAPRIGVACAGTPNRGGSGPDDLLYVRATGTPLAK
jgi:hypothetical protein